MSTQVLPREDIKLCIRELIFPQGLESATHQQNNYQHDGKIPSCTQNSLHEVDRTPLSPIITTF